MTKNTNLCVNLKTIMQHDAILSEGQCYRGVLTRDAENHYLFEEATHTLTDRHGQRNPKLFDGDYCSLVHMQNGRYQVHMKTITAGKDLDCNALAFAVYSELLNALNIIDGNGNEQP
ncbi:MAG: hypothetical protein MJZ35_09210 [Bacteroidaceae bacterium]|nr:hypothetical protein [Bacteroidaceae bacterium]